MHGLKLDRRRLRTRRCGVGHIDARHPGAVEHQPLCTLWAGRAPEGVALNSAHRRGVGFDLHQAHRRAARSALHHAPRYQARTWNALADHAVKRPLRIAQRRGRGATNCDEIGAVRGRLWAYPLAACGHSGDCNFRWAWCRRRKTLRLVLPDGQARKAISADWQAVPLRFRPVIRARCGGPCTRSHASASPPEPGSAYWFDFEGCRLTHPLRPAPTRGCARLCWRWFAQV